MAKPPPRGNRTIVPPQTPRTQIIEEPTMTDAPIVDALPDDSMPAATAPVASEPEPGIVPVVDDPEPLSVQAAALFAHLSGYEKTAGQTVVNTNDAQKLGDYMDLATTIVSRHAPTTPDVVRVLYDFHVKHRQTLMRETLAMRGVIGRKNSKAISTLYTIMREAVTRPGASSITGARADQYLTNASAILAVLDDICRR